MEGTTFASDLSAAAKLAMANCAKGMTVRIELSEHGFVVIGVALSEVRPVVRDYKQVVPYRDAELSDGYALYAAVRKVVTGLGKQFVDTIPPIKATK